MALDPSASVWPSLAKAALYLVWLVLAGLPLARAVFGQRRADAWLAYAPATSLAANLLALNSLMWILPGAAGTWTATALVSALAGIVWFRSRSNSSFAALNPGRAGFMVVLILGMFLFAVANRTQVLFADEPSHLPLASMIARGFFPPVSPFTPDVAAAYPYGPHLLAAAMMQVSGVPPWTAFYLVSPLIATALSATVLALAYDVGGSLIVAAFTALVPAFLSSFGETLFIGLPRILDADRRSEGPWGLLLQFGVPASSQPTDRYGPLWLNTPHFALGLAMLFLLAGSLNLGAGKRKFVLAGASLATLNIAEPTVFLFAAPAVAVLAPFIFWRLQGRARWTFAAAVVGGLAYAMLAGGVMTDALLRGAGSYAAASVMPDFDLSRWVPRITAAAGQAFVPNTASLAVIVLAAALALRSAGLGFLAAVAVAGLLAEQVLKFEIAGASTVEARLLYGPYLVAAVGALAGLAGLASKLPRTAAWAGNSAIVILIVVPTALPRLVSAGEIAGRGIELGYPVVQDAGVGYLNPTRYATALRSNWEIYAWMRSELPRSARVLSPDSALVSLTTGLPAPRSTPALAACCETMGPEYADALRFLARADLMALGVTHLHWTSASEAVLSPAGRAALADGRQFRLLKDFRDRQGEPHQVFEILRGAGAATFEPSSLAALRAVAHDVDSVTLLGPTAEELRRWAIMLFARDARIYVKSTVLPRIAANPRVQGPEGALAPGLLILPDWQTPTALGLDTSDSVWQGYGSRAYLVGPGRSWSQVWRPPIGKSTPSAEWLRECSDLPVPFALRIAGESGSSMEVNGEQLRLTGVSQVQRVNKPCTGLEIVWNGEGLNPFVQIGPIPGAPQAEPPPVAVLAFDGALDEGELVVNLWYRNPGRVTITDGTEIRLYESDSAGMAAAERLESVAWWPGPIVLSSDLEQATIRFDAKRLAIEGIQGIAESLPGDGDYQLALTIAGLRPGEGELTIRQVIPIALLKVQGDEVDYVVLSGVIAIRA